MKNFIITSVLVFFSLQTVFAAEITEANKQLYNFVINGETDESKLKGLIAKGADVNFKIPNGGIPFLLHAVERSHVKTTALLLKNGACVNLTCDRDGYTPLMQAVEDGNLEIFNLLLKYNADESIKNKANETATDISVKKFLED